MVSVVTSFSPRFSSSRTILETVCSIRSGSNGTRRPLRLITISSRSCTRSKVVKRNPQAKHNRRRLIAAESSVGRESFTWVSRLAQVGQRMVRSSTVNRKTGQQILDLVAHRRFNQMIRLDTVLRQNVKHLGDQCADLAELGGAEPAGGAGRRPETDAGRHRGFFRIERNAVLVAGNVRTSQ